MTRIEALRLARIGSIVLLAAACGNAAADGRLASQVDRELDGSPLLGGTRIEVAARDGVVTLSGVVANEGQAEQAERIAWSVDGVEDVESRLELAAAGASPPPVAAPPAAQEGVTR